MVYFGAWNSTLHLVLGSYIIHSIVTPTWFCHVPINDKLTLHVLISGITLKYGMIMKLWVMCLFTISVSTLYNTLKQSVNTMHFILWQIIYRYLLYHNLSHHFIVSLYEVLVGMKIHLSERKHGLLSCFTLKLVHLHIIFCSLYSRSKLCDIVGAKVVHSKTQVEAIVSEQPLHFTHSGLSIYPPSHPPSIHLCMLQHNIT